MIKLIRNTNRSIIDNDYNNFACVLVCLSIISIVIFGVFTGGSYFVATPESMGKLTLIAPPNDKIWLIGFITIITSAIFGIFTIFADYHYGTYDDRRFLVAWYFWIFVACSGALLIVTPFILLYVFTKYLFCAVNFCFEHFFLLFAPRKTKEKMIVQTKTEKEMIKTYNNLLRN